MKLFTRTAQDAGCCTFLQHSIELSENNTNMGIVILHTNDVHCSINADDNSFGYAELAAYRAKLESEGYKTLLVDAGDSIQGDVIGTLSDGSYPLRIMNELCYDLAVPGNHEFDFGMDNFFRLKNNSEFPYISANFVDLTSGSIILDSYKIIETGGVKIGFVGISTPETTTKSTPSFFKNENGEYIYGFCSGNNGNELYSAVQTAVDTAYSEGAEYIVAVGHLGTDAQSSPWTSKEVIANVSGINVFIDGHSHDVIDGETVPDKSGKSVLLASAGTKLAEIGTVMISKGGISSKLISKSDFTVSYDTSSSEYTAYSKMNDFVKSIEAEFSVLAQTVVAKTDVDLIINDPETNERIIRNTETNLGNLCADAYRSLLGADIGFVNGGGIRANIEKGDITYAKIIAVHPFGNSACLIEATGQQILDALELGSASVPEESGGFLQVSGITYEIHTYIPSSVVLTDNKEFVKVDGEYRVKNVKVGREPLDLNKTYKLASQNYMLKAGSNGYTMFSGCNNLKENVMIDNQVLINYITEALGGNVGSEYAAPYGQGRIKVIESADDVFFDADDKKDASNSGKSVIVSVMSISAAIA
ncbi:MAG: bifunctional metallophosphatase/5'-nucleotidase [Oscillospiraceae bacterium]